MADFSLPALTSTYIDVIESYNNKIAESAKMFDETQYTNLPVGTIKWNSTNARFEKWDGTNWYTLASIYQINVSTFDGFGSSQFLRSDVSDTFNGDLTISGAVQSNTLQYTRSNNLPSGTDLNIVDGLSIPSGFYDCDATTSANTPYAGWIYLEVQRHINTNGYCKQIVTQLNTSPTRQWIRTQEDGTWSNWYEIFTDGNMGSGSGLDADLLDGKDSTAFALVNGDNTKTFKVANAVNADEAVNKGQLNLQATQSLSDAQSYDIGVIQGWQDVTSSRSLDTNYSNTTGKPIMISITMSGGGSSQSDVYLYIDGELISRDNDVSPNSGFGTAANITAIIPNLGVYKVTGTGNLMWWELR